MIFPIIGARGDAVVQELAVMRCASTENVLNGATSNRIRYAVNVTISEDVPQRRIRLIKE
jgi:hypothetical protein